MNLDRRDASLDQLLDIDTQSNFVQAVHGDDFKVRNKIEVAAVRELAYKGCHLLFQSSGIHHSRVESGENGHLLAHRLAAADDHDLQSVQDSVVACTILPLLTCLTTVAAGKCARQ